MIGLGKWRFFLDTMMYRGEAFLEVRDNDGKYAVKIQVPGHSLPQLQFGEIHEAGDTLSGNAVADIMRGLAVPFSVTFDGDRASGTLKLPVLGKLHLRDGVRVSATAKE